MSVAQYAWGVTVPATSTFEGFVAAHGRTLGGFALLITGDPHDAQDTLQEVLIGLYPKWQRVAGQGDPLAYVRRSIINRHLSARRKLRRLVALDHSRIPATDPMPMVDGRDWAIRLIGTLPERQRVAVVLRVMEEREFAEIADVLGVSEANARKIVSRGMAALRARLTEGNPDVR
ncbi:MAG: SigE family RNA polymerase sigma factor [Propionibacteriaceae bacterium]|nr:SigE family RNA polymerase sigma factor [Propionibacteriaceae bacterium]